MTGDKTGQWVAWLAILATINGFLLMLSWLLLRTTRRLIREWRAEVEVEQLTGETFDVPSGSEPVFGLPTGPVRLVNVHRPEMCQGEACVIHNPSEHHMREWPLHWRGDRPLIERTCEHGVGHPDPDDIAYRKRVGKYTDADAEHGCDSCCGVPL